MSKTHKIEWIVEVHHIATPGGGEARKRFLTREEWSRIWAQAQTADTAPHVRLTALLAFGLFLFPPPDGDIPCPVNGNR